MKLNTPLRSQFTAEELYGLNEESLPGFKSSDDVFRVLDIMPKNESLWQPVISATIVTKYDGGIHILTGNRISEGNRTHVNVASTPTMRIPAQEAGFLLSERIPFCLNGKIDPMNPFVSDSLSPSTPVIPDNSDVLSSKISHLLALKLELGSCLERSQQPIGVVSLARCVVGFSYLEDNYLNKPLYEPLIMMGAVVGLDSRAAKEIPARTSSYSHLGWAPIDKYVHGVSNKRLHEVIPSAGPDDELEVCVRGLCNATSSMIVSDPSEIIRHLSEDGTINVF